MNGLRRLQERGALHAVIFILGAVLSEGGRVLQSYGLVKALC